jgi:hypothetical protein
VLDLSVDVTEGKEFFYFELTVRKNVDSDMLSSSFSSEWLGEKVLIKDVNYC